MIINTHNKNHKLAISESWPEMLTKHEVLQNQWILCNQELANLVLQIPDAISVRKFVMCGAYLRKNSTLKSTHVEQEIWIVFAVN